MRALAHSRRGGLLLTGCDDGLVRLWEVTGRRLLRELPHDDRILALAFSPDGKAILTGCADGSAYLWRLAGGEEITQASLAGRAVRFAGPVKLAHSAEQEVRAVAFSPDGRLLVTGSAGRLGGQLRFWDAAGRPLTAGPESLRYGVHAVAFSPTGGHFATAAGSLFKGEAQLWQYKGSAVCRLGEPLPHQAEVYTVTFSARGDLLTAGQDRAARLWDVRSGLAVGQPLRHAKDVRAAVFSPDGGSVWTAGDEGVVRRWQVSRGLVPQRDIPFPGLLGSAVLALAGSADGRKVFAGGVSDAEGFARLLDPASGECLCAFPPGQRVLAVGCDAKARLLVTGGGGERKQNWVRLWDSAGKPVSLFYHTGIVRSVALHLDGGFVAAGSEDGVIRLWDAREGHPCWKQNVGPGRVYAVSFSPDRRTLLSGHRDGYARLWDVKTGRRLCEWRHPDSVLSAAFAADGRTILTGYAGGARLWVWDGAPDKEPIAEGPPLEHMAGVVSVALSRDGRKALTGGTDGVVWLWDTVTKKPLGPPWRHPGVAFGVFGPGEATVVTASSHSAGLGLGTKTPTVRGAVWVWDIPGGVGGKSAHLARWAEQINGLHLDKGGISQMDYGSWEKGRSRLRQLGGPPPVEKALARAGERASVLPAGERQLAPAQRIPLRDPDTVARGPKPPPPTTPSPRPATWLAWPEVGAVDKPFLTGEQVERYLPAGATAVAVIDLRRVFRSRLVHERARPSIDEFLQANKDHPLLQLLRAAGVNPLRDLDGLVLATTDVQRLDATLLVVRGRFDAERLKAVDAHVRADREPKVTPVTREGKRYYTIEVGGLPLSAHRLDADTLLVAVSDKTLVEAAKRGAKKPDRIHKEIQAALREFTGRETLFAGLVVTDELKKLLGEVPQAKSVAPKLRGVTARLTLADAARFSLRINTEDADSAKAVLDLVNLGVAVVKTFIQGNDQIPTFAGKLVDRVKVGAADRIVHVDLEATAEMFDTPAKK